MGLSSFVGWYAHCDYIGSQRRSYDGSKGVLNGKLF